MNYNCFLKEITQRVRERVYDGCTVEVKPVRKNNGIVLDCMSISRPGENICPNIYLNEPYERYLSGWSMDEVASCILSTWQNSVPAMEINADDLINARIIREQVVYRLVNYEKNAALLEDIPHRKVLDLALIYYVIVHTEALGDGAIMVRNDYLDYYSITQQELDEYARVNTRILLPADVVRISDLLREFGERSGVSSYADISLEEESWHAPMYVLTNAFRQYGACYMTDMELLHRISQNMDTDLYLLPSSVHECMIVPASMYDDTETLASMVREINRDQVSKDEFLSDTVYRYRDQPGKLEIAS